MLDLLSRRRLLTSLALLTQPQVKTHPTSGESHELLPDLQRRFGSRVHPDLRSVKIVHRKGVVSLMMEVGTNAAWAGAFHDFDGMHSCSGLTVVNDLSWWGLVPGSSAADSAQRLLRSPDMERIGVMIGLLNRGSGRQNTPDNLAR